MKRFRRRARPGRAFSSGTGVTAAAAGVAMFWLTAVLNVGAVSGTVVAWGDNRDGQTNVPPTLTNAISISTSYEHSLALLDDGTVVAWGPNNSGQCDVPPGLTNVVQVQAGADHSLALRKDGTIVGWGNTSVPSGLSNIVAIAAGAWHDLALRSDGTVVAWGRNDSGQATVPPGLSNVVAVAAGVMHSVALTGDGRVVHWGDDAGGSLFVPQGLSNVVDVAAGLYIDLAVKGDGTLVVWGINLFGDTIVPAGLGNVVAAAGGHGHCMALCGDGRVVAWGNNDSGQTNVPAGVTNVLSIGAGWLHSEALSGSGSPAIVRQPRSRTVAAGSTLLFSVGVVSLSGPAFQWTFNGTNVPGATNSTLRIEDVQERDAGVYAVTVSMGAEVLVSRDAVLTVLPAAPNILLQPASAISARNGWAQFSVVAQGSEPTACQWRLDGVPLPGETNTILFLTNLSAGQTGNYSCLLSNVGGQSVSSNASLSFATMLAWGIQSSATQVPAGLTNVAQFSVGASHTLALNADGTVIGWGRNDFGEAVAPPGLSNVIMVAAGGVHSLALRSDGTVFAWGIDPNNDYGQTNVPPGLSNVVAIAAGYYHSLALKRDGTMVAWGNNWWGQSVVPAGLSNVVAIAGGSYQSMALKDDGTVAAWGGVTVPAGTSNIVAIAGGSGSGLGLREDGTVVGWGPTVPAGLSNVVSVSAGGDHWMALRNDGSVVVWGGDGYGQSDLPARLFNGVGIGAGEYYSVAQLDGRSPLVVRAPLNRKRYTGQSVVLSAGAAGVPPLHYHWFHDGAAVLDATNASLSLVNIQSTDSGDYSLWIADALGNSASTQCHLDAVESGPIITVQPVRVIVPVGSAAAFQVAVDGSLPIAYQWRFNGVDISGATNALLTLTNLFWNNEGLYTVVISNQFGVTVSSNALLTIPRSRIVAWGDNIYNQTNVPAGILNPFRIAGGRYHSLAIQSEGTVAGWGYNSASQITIPPGLGDIVSVAAGAFHSLALRADGTVVAWGANTSLQTNVPAGLSNVVAIAAGTSSCLALRSNGTVVAWGQSLTGQSNILSSLTDAVAIGVGAAHALAVHRDGTVVAWGDNGYGQASVPAGLSNVVEVCGGMYHSLALRGDGSVVAWGNGTYGQTNIPAGLSNVIAIAAGNYHCLALKCDGTVIAWGRNNEHETNVPPGVVGVSDIGAGGWHSLAIVNDGPLIVVVQPRNQTIYSGCPASFGVEVLGARPLKYQWQVNGTNIPGATNATLTLLSAQPGDAGLYRVAIRNSFGSVMSSNAVLDVVVSPPQFSLQPVDQAVMPGSNALFTAAAYGSLPITYQWLFNGTNISGATNASLGLTNVQAPQQGVYAVVASNPGGSTTSSNAFLAVLDLAQALNATNLVWTTSGDRLWFPETGVSHDGIAAASSGPVGWTNQSVLQTTVVGPGTLTFWWQVSGIMLYSLAFSVDGTTEASISSGPGWQQNTFYLPDGTHTLQWNCRESFPGYSVTGWVDQVSYIPGASAPVILIPPASRTVPAGTNVSFDVLAGGTPTLKYQWQFNAMDIPGATGSYLSVSNVQAANAGTYSVRVSNEYGTTNSSANLTVNPSAPVIWVQPANQEAVLGGNCLFSLVARGSDPLSCQWQFNGAPIAGATHSGLLVTGVQSNSLGNYSVVVSNAYGSTLSSNATITLVPRLLVAWGADFFGQCDVPWSLTNVSAFAGGWDYCAAANSNGPVVSWGFPEPGFSPAPTNVTAIAAGSSFILALEDDGTVAAAGTTVPAGLTGVTAIAAGSGFSLALRDDGSVVAWGDGTLGQTNVPPGMSNVTAIACGWLHALALTGDGRVTAWGYNGFGQTDVPPGLSNVVAIAAGWYHSLALRSDGTVVGWGYDDRGQTDIPAGLSNVVSIAGGWLYSLALKSDGTVVAWGQALTEVTNIPVLVTNVTAISGGDEHCLALLGNGAPHAIRPPSSQIAFASDTVILNAGVVGAEPMQYQWQLNGTNIAGATGALLILSNVPVTSAGQYQCVVSNALGSLTTSSATLTVARLPLCFDTAPGSLGLGDEGFRLRVLNLAGAGNVMIEASSDLVNWQPVWISRPLVGSVEFTDANAGNSARRFYRASEGGAFAVGPLRFDNAGATNGGFWLHLTGLSGHGPVVLYSSSDLMNWDPLRTNPPLVGSLFFLDSAASNPPVRFYRAMER